MQYQLNHAEGIFTAEVKKKKALESQIYPEIHQWPYPGSSW